MEEKKTARLTNSITSTAFRSFNKWGGVTYEDILSNYPKELIETCWATLGRFVLENYQMGKGTSIKGLGTFTFTNVEYSLEGTTNQYRRDIKKRRPVFIVSPEFVDYLRPGQFTEKSGIMYYTQKINNSISICKVNYALLSYGANISKEEYVTIVSSIIRDMSDQIRRGVFRNKYLPYVGSFIIKGNVLGVKFEEKTDRNALLQSQKLFHTKKNLDLSYETKQSVGVRQRNIDDIDKAVREIRPATAVITHVSPSGDEWLRKEMDIDVKKIEEETRQDLLVPKPINKKEYYVDQRYYREYPTQDLRGLRISQDILESISKGKNLIIRNMKPYDIHGDGMISKFDFICGFVKANVNYKVKADIVTDITNKYLLNKNDTSEYVNYVKLVNAICSDIDRIVKNEYAMFPIDKYKYTIGEDNKRAVSAFAFSSRDGNLAQPALSNTTVYGSNLYIRDVSEEDVKGDILRVKKIANYIGATKRYNRLISYLELISILQSYSISISKPQMLRILNFLKIKNPNAFSFHNFLKTIGSVSFVKPSNKVTQSEINAALSQISRSIKECGGADYFFKDKEEVGYDEFIDRVRQCNLTTRVLRAVFDYITSNRKNLTKMNFDKHLKIKGSKYDNDFDIKAMKDITDKIVKNEMRPDTYFDHLLSYNICRQENVFTFDEFQRLLELEHFNYDANDMKAIFDYIDFNHDGIIDRIEWNTMLNKIPHPVTTIQHYIRNKKMSIENICYRLGLDVFDRNFNNVLNTPIDRNKFKSMLKLFDENFSNEFIFSLFDSIKSPNGTITPNEMLKYFNIYKTNAFLSIDPEKIRNTVISSLLNRVSFKDIINEMQAIDHNITGKMPVKQFIEITKKYCNEDDMLRFVRMYHKVDTHDNVYYHEVLSMIFLNAKDNSFEKCIAFLKKYLSEECNNDLYLFFVKMNNMENGWGQKKFIRKDRLFEFFRNKIDMLQENTMNLFDVDKDGIVSFDDMKATIINHIDKEFFDNKVQIAKDNAAKKEQIHLDGICKTLNAICKEIKEMNMTEVNLFKFLDENKDCLISYDEYNRRINYIINFDQKTKDDLFRFFDVYQNKQINIETFLSKMKYGHKDDGYKGNFVIEKLIIQELAKWCERNMKYSDTEIFSILDSDADGKVKINDMKKFAINSLMLSANEVNDSTVNRVLVSISANLNGNVTLSDVRDFIDDVYNENVNKYLARIKQLCNAGVCVKNNDKDWMNDIIDRIGMFISSNYGTAEKFIEDISNGSEVDYQKWKLFVERNWKVFDGFKLTDKEKIVMFNNISHGKKFINVNDIKKIYNEDKYNFYKKMHQEIFVFINENFSTSEDAFKFFNKVVTVSNIAPTTIDPPYPEFITVADFFKAIQKLFPGKYKTEMVNEYIRRNFPTSIDSKQIQFSEFTYVYFGRIEFNTRYLKKLPEDSKIKTTRVFTSHQPTLNNPFFTKEHLPLMTPFDHDSLLKIKRLILSSKCDFQQLLKDTIITTGGYANQYEFRNMIKKFNLGLTAIEIDDIIEHSGITRDGYINLYDFYKYVTNTEANLQMNKETALNKLKEIKQLIYKYYTNPRLAFTLNDREISSHIDFDKFKKIILDIYAREKKKSPNYPVLKYIYDYIDIRKDGIIDTNEWNRIFSIAEGSLDLKADKGKMKLLREWETSSDVSKIYLMIARSKKIIRDKVKLFTFDGNTILGDNLIAILKDVLGRIRLSNTQWKMIIAPGDRDKSGMIDFNMFMDIVNVTAKMERSHPLSSKKYI